MVAWLAVPHGQRWGKALVPIGGVSEQGTKGHVLSASVAQLGKPVLMAAAWSGRIASRRLYSPHLFALG